MYQAHKQKGVLLNANECSRPVPEIVLYNLATTISSMHLNRYPQDDCRRLRELYGSLMNLPAEDILVTNGSDASLQILITAFCRKKPLVVVAPDFEMYNFYAGCVDAPVYALETAWDGSFDVQALIDLAREKDAGLVLLSNPNNPTGHLLSSTQIETLASSLGDIFLGVDEAYMEFADQTALPLLDKYPNIAVTRTLSKAWGLAGARIGFLISNAEVIEKLAGLRIVYSVSTLDMMAALSALSHPEYKDVYVDVIRQEQKRIEQALQQMPWLQAGEFNANFYSIVYPGNMDALEAAFERHGITIRTWPHQQRARITIGLKPENDQVLAVLHELGEKK